MVISTAYYTLSTDTVCFKSVCQQLGFTFFIITTTAGADFARRWENTGCDNLYRLFPPDSNNTVTSSLAATACTEVLNVLNGITGMKYAHFAC